MKCERDESVFARTVLAGACVAACVAACAQVPGGGSGQPAPAAPTPEAESQSPPPKLRGIKPAELPREEPGVGLGGLTHQPAQPAQ